MYKALVRVTLRPSILDPQGKATLHALESLGYDSIENVRIGKHIEMRIDAESREEAESVALAAAQKVLSNPVMEDFEVTVEAEPTVTA